MDKLENNNNYMIIGYYPSKPNQKIQYDYVICDAKKGLTKDYKELELKEDYYYLRKEKIKEVLFIGFSDFEFDIFSKISNEFNEKIKKVKLEKNKIEELDMIKAYSDIISEYIKEEEE